MKLSQWHDGNVKPVHIGVYERDIDDLEFKFSYWDGEYWLIACAEINEAFKYKDITWMCHSAWQTDVKWRGIIK